MDVPALYLTAGSVYSPGQEGRNVSDLKPRLGGQISYKEASKILGRKGLRYKDEATLMALINAQQVLDGIPELSQEERDRTGVVVTSNLGNLDTVVNNAEIIAREHVDATSVMALPNASSNAVSTSVAIVFQLRGPNIMLCNGNGSGLDALRLAQDLMTAGRADRVLIIGVEVDNSVVRKLIPSDSVRYHGAAGYLLERETLTSGQASSSAIAKIEVTDNPRSNLTNHIVQQHVGDASSVTGIMHLLIATEYVRKKGVQYLNKDGMYWKVSCP